MKNKLSLTVICVYNQKQIVEQYLLKSIDKQNVEVEVILIDNQRNIYPSAANALNYGASLATGNYFIFVHQDVVFQQNDVLYTIYHFLKEHPSAIIGTAGIIIGEKGVYSHIVHGEDKIPAGSNDISHPQRIDILDECLIGMKKTMFQAYSFDEHICSGWDLYVVDICLASKLKDIYVYVLPLDIWHVSGGNAKHAFYACARNLYKKYRHKIKRIQTCCITIPIPTNFLSTPILWLLELAHITRRKKP